MMDKAYYDHRKSLYQNIICAKKTSDKKGAIAGYFSGKLSHLMEKSATGAGREHALSEFSGYHGVKIRTPEELREKILIACDSLKPMEIDRIYKECVDDARKKMQDASLGRPPRKEARRLNKLFGEGVFSSILYQQDISFGQKKSPNENEGKSKERLGDFHDALIDFDERKLYE